MDKELNNQFGQSNNHPNSSETTGGDEFGQSTKQLTNSSETPVGDEFGQSTKQLTNSSETTGGDEFARPPISPMRGDGGWSRNAVCL